MIRKRNLNFVSLILAILAGSLIGGCYGLSPVITITPTSLPDTNTPVPISPTIPPTEQIKTPPTSTPTLEPTSTSTLEPSKTSIPSTQALPVNQLSPELQVITPQNVNNLQNLMQVSQTGAQAFAWLSGQPSVAMTTGSEVFVENLAPASLTSHFNIPISSIFEISPDGKSLVSVTEDFKVKIWDLATGAELNTLTGHENTITGLSFSPDNKILASSSLDNTIRIWDVASGKLITTWTFKYWPADVQFSPDGKQIASIDTQDSTVYILNSENGKEEKSLVWAEHASPVIYEVLFSPDWKTIAWIARGTVQLMDASNGALGLTLNHEDFITSTSWSPDSRMLATGAAATVEGNFQPVATIWDISTGKSINVLVQPNPIVSLHFSPEGKSLGVLTNDGVLNLWGVKP